jgi:hypothetical protein
MVDSGIEEIERRPRRRHTLSEKRRIVELTFRIHSTNPIVDEFCGVRIGYFAVLAA